MKHYFLFFFLILSNCFGQEVSEINKVLEIPDSLEYEQEIRIYKDYSIANKFEILRMFKDQNKEWVVYRYWYSKEFKDVTKINVIRFPKENIGKLKPKNADLIWLKILITNVEFLPDMESIRYKFGTPFIDSDRGEPAIVNKKILVTDGDAYKVFVRNEKNKNNFSFNNPKTYLKHYPAVDELISYNELLSVINKELNLLNY
ncbi:hypothetical protein [Flavobacterium limi]|uniref:Uncharacterized protein n=1 Tax=Flavobacterium limi TaxID=2045105 RepID=A0ABQ1UJ83_9FLAO|nr:hypothetical protein [Flavobacterium limi]GGF20416.1 hypothetical protein GCM10011518_32110 [Flavobacterium limi]